MRIKKNYIINFEIEKQSQGLGEVVDLGFNNKVS